MSIDFNQLDTETQAMIFPLLPVFIRELSDHFGLPVVLALVSEFGGCEIGFVKPPPPGVESENFNRVARVVGEENAARLQAHFSVEGWVYIPRCAKAMQALRDRQIIDQWYAIRLASNSARKASNEIARRFKMSYRAVDKIVNGSNIKYRRGDK